MDKIKQELKDKVGQVIDEQFDKIPTNNGIKSTREGYITPHFKWEETYQGNKSAKGYKYILTKYEINATILAVLLEELREYVGKPIVPTNWFRPTYYNDVVLPSKGYKTSTSSDHKEARAIDTKSVKLTKENIEKWKEICHSHGLHYSIGKYVFDNPLRNYIHLGFEWYKDYEWGKDWWK